MGSHSWWLQQLFYMQWLLKSASLYVVLCSSVLKRKTKIWTYHPHLKFNQEAILPFSWCIMCVGRDSLRHVNSFLEVLRGPLGTKAPFPFWEVEHCTCTGSCTWTWSTWKTQNITGLPNRRSHPLATCQVFVCWGDCSRADRHFPMTGKGDDRTDWL